MISSSRVPVPNATVICRLTDDGAVLVSPEAGNLRVLNLVGATIWQLLDGERDVAALQAELVARYQIPREQAAADLDAFLGDLERRQLVAWKPAS